VRNFIVYAEVNQRMTRMGDMRNAFLVGRLGGNDQLGDLRGDVTGVTLDVKK
jgi:hypothetical protein